MKTIKIIIEGGFKYFICFSLAIAGLFSMSSCDDDGDGIDESVPNRMFRPVAFTASSTVEETSFNWVPISGAASYYLEISKDSLEFTNEVQKVSLEVSSSYRIKGLLSKTRYSARIKTVSAKTDVLDSEFNSITFLIP